MRVALIIITIIIPTYYNAEELLVLLCSTAEEIAITLSVSSVLSLASFI